MTKKREKVCYVGVPAIFNLELECKHISRAFGGYGVYLVGSAIERPNWRDVDVVLIMEDERFRALFPGTYENGHPMWEFDERWLLIVISISERMSRTTGLPVDFKIQPQSYANKHHDGPRHAMGLTFAREMEPQG